MNTRCIKAIAILATLTAAGAATASPINVAYTGMGSGSNTRITFGSTTLTTFTGQLKHNLTGGAGNASLFNGAQTAYCIDLAQRVTSNVSTFEVVSPSVVTNLVSPTLGPARAQAYTDLYSVFGSQAIAANASNDFGTAFQMLAWEIMYDYNPSLGTSSLDLSAGNSGPGGTAVGPAARPVGVSEQCDSGPWRCGASGPFGTCPQPPSALQPLMHGRSGL